MPSKRKLNPKQVQAKVARATGKAVARMIKALSLYHGKDSERWLYNEFREQKRKVYALYLGDEHKAKSIVKFAIVQSGWGSRRE